ncbi:MAG TPA: diguanylate cyclase, partial [Magnetococcales bacterium]|nr:diguanylate cyclase [Magnetococcales bacterium]
LYFYSEHERKTILMQNDLARTEQTQGVVNGLKAIMIPGFASVAQAYAEQLRKVPGMVDFHIMRLDGREAFLDNETIEDVNWRRGREVFPLRHEQIQGRQILVGNDPNLRRALEGREAVYYQEHGDDNEILQSILIPIANERECHLCHGDGQPLRGVVKLTTSLAHVEKAIADARFRAGELLIVSLGLLLVMMYVLIRKTVVGPINLVDSAMGRVSAGNLSLHVPVLGNDELGRMAQNFNIMVDRLLQTYNGLHVEQNKLSTIILSAQEGIIVTDALENVVLVNPAAERLLGKSTQQIIEGGFVHFMDDSDYVRQLIETGGVNMPDMVVYNQSMLSIHAARISTSSGEIIGSAAMIRDVTEQKKLEKKLTDMSYTDKLTGLFNRRRMEEIINTEFERAVRYGVPLSFMLLDVDHFKKFNDRYGHDMGDRILQAVGQCMLHFFRKLDAPCRYGGEEFCVILTSTPSEIHDQGPFLLADKFRKAIEAMVTEGLKVTVSVGVAVMIHREYADVASMIKAADKALYQAKNAGRNQVMVARVETNEEPVAG